MMYQHLSPDYQAKVLARWGEVLGAGKEIKSQSAKLATALVLENTQREFDKTQMIKESYTGSLGGMGAGAGTNLSPSGGGALGSDFTTGRGGINDSRLPTVVIPTLRRIFPELVAHDLVGIQPMNGPVGLAFALRNKYSVNAAGTASNATYVNDEMGYNTVNSFFTGTSGFTAQNLSGDYSATVPGVGALSTPNDYWTAFYGTGANLGGMGQDMQSAEWWAIGEDMPMAKFELEKGVVEARTRKLAAHWSLELGEDMMNMHGVDVNNEMVNVMSYEIQAEIDRQLLAEMAKAAINGGKTSTWSPVSADGRNQLERIGTIYTQVLIKSQAIAIATRRGPATFCVASPTLVALLERLGDFTLDNAAVDASGANVGIAKVGAMRNGGIGLYRDTFAAGNYMLLGYKGPTAYDSGIIYCPYIPLQLNDAVGQEDFTPRMGLRTRYGVLANLFGSANYYQFVKVDGITDSVLGDASNGRVFTY